ncbi:hypothetical protein DH2020_032919 [Rehmannia glutinosa]|uniref:RRM domain-containing protein n=1 Tax=Rehmannia glutinosa TaxID=99300 RepID=A0ABR0VE10_REHGL
MSMRGREESGRQRYKQDRRYQARQGYIKSQTFFVTNFPGDWNQRDLWELFQRYGKVWDVFIPNKRSRNGGRFGFVRFVGVDNAKSLEATLDQIWIGSYKLRVNIPRFSKWTGSTSGEALIQREYKIKPEQASRRSIRSFKEVLLENGFNIKNEKIKEHQNSTEEGADFVWTTHEEETKWLQGCFLGKMHDLTEWKSFQAELWRRGYHSVNIKPMGGGWVLIQANATVEKLQSLSFEWDWVKEWIQQLKPWSNDSVIKERFVWLICEGLPPHVWSEKYFAELTSRIGSFIRLDESTKQKKRLDFGRVLVSTENFANISMLFKIKINNRMFNVRIFEEPVCLCNTEHGRRDREFQPELTAANFGCSDYDSESSFGQSGFSEFVPETIIEQSAAFFKIGGNLNSEHTDGVESREDAPKALKFVENCPLQINSGAHNNLEMTEAAHNLSDNITKTCQDPKKHSEPKSPIRILSKPKVPSCPKTQQLNSRSPISLIDKHQVVNLISQTTPRVFNNNQINTQNEGKLKKENKPKAKKKGIRRKNSKILRERWRTFSAEMMSDEEDDGKNQKETREETNQVSVRSFSITDSDIRFCNEKWMKEQYEKEAKETWDLGKKLGVEGQGNEDEIVRKLMEMEQRDVQINRETTRGGEGKRVQNDNIVI